VLVYRRASVAVPSALDPDTVRGSTAVAGRPEEEAVMPNPSTSSRRPRPSSTPTPILPTGLSSGREQGRRTVDAVQSGPVKNLTVDIEDTTVPGGPSGQVSVRILRPRSARRPLAVILYLHGAGWVFGNHHTHDRLIRELAVGAQAAVVLGTVVGPLAPTQPPATMRPSRPPGSWNHTAGLGTGQYPLAWPTRQPPNR
jgi:hypothetical protein